MSRLHEIRDYKINNILVVDDEVAICHNLKAFLEDYGYRVSLAHDGKDGLEVFNSIVPDLVILDLHMPVMSGHALLSSISATHQAIPKIVMSGVGVIREAMQTINEGSWDFISKPLHDFDVLLHKIKQCEEKATLLLQNQLYQKHLEQLVEERTEDVNRLNLQIIENQKEIVAKLGDVIESRSEETGNHVRRVAYLSKMLALACGLEPEEAEIIRMASPLHDVGKIGIPDTILNKNGRLTEEEFEQIKSHTIIGYDILKGSDQPIVQVGAIIAKQHHERWDGLGYPGGLKGEEIHIYGRITCIADNYDALRHARPYKEGWSAEVTQQYLHDNSGIFFDPHLVDLFLKNIYEAEEILHRHRPLATKPT